MLKQELLHKDIKLYQHVLMELPPESFANIIVKTLGKTLRI